MRDMFVSTTSYLGSSHRWASIGYNYLLPLRRLDMWIPCSLLALASHDREESSGAACVDHRVAL